MKSPDPLRVRLTQFQVSHAPTLLCGESREHYANACQELAAALAAPEGETTFPIPLNAAQEAAAKQWAADDRLWTTHDTVEINLRTFARVILRDAVLRAAPAAEGKVLCVIGQYCHRHGFIHGAEVEELRERLGKLHIAAVDAVLNAVDARDAVAYLEVTEAARAAAPQEPSCQYSPEAAVPQEPEQIITIDEDGIVSGGHINGPIREK